MTTTLPRLPPRGETVADLIERLGDIPPNRIRLHPPPGTATERDVLEIQVREDRLFELVDGVLVEKPTGFPESLVASVIIRVLGTFVHQGKLGVVSGEAGMMRLLPGLIRIPDVAFISRARLAEHKVTTEQVAPVAPNLAVEVLSPSNTPREIQQKLFEYFQAGAELAWIVDLGRRSVSVYTSADQFTILTEDQVLDGAQVIPGFSMPVRDLFADLDETWSV